MESIQISCSTYCMRCQNIGTYYVNYSKYHKMCTTCSNHKYSGILECFHCKSLLFSLPECYIQCEEINSSLQIDHKVKQSIYLNDQNIISKAIQESPILINELIYKDCQLCLKPFEESLIIKNQILEVCINCAKTIKEAQGECEKVPCISCESIETTELRCGHYRCQDCIKPQQCSNCFNNFDFECCSTECGQALCEKYAGCQHPKCPKCPNNLYCFDKNCIERNFKHSIGELKKCTIDQKNYVSEYLILNCGDAVCKNCFTFNLASTNFYCFYCIEKLKKINCFYCKVPMEWAYILDNYIYKNCCRKSYCLICYSEVDQTLVHKCKINLSALTNKFISFLKFNKS